MTTGHRRAASKQPAEIDDIMMTSPMTSPERTRHEQRWETEPSDDKRERKRSQASKQETAAQPHYSGRNAQFRSQPEIYKNNRKQASDGQATTAPPHDTSKRGEGRNEAGALIDCRNHHIRRRRFNQLTADDAHKKTPRPVHRNRAGGRGVARRKERPMSNRVNERIKRTPVAAIRRRDEGGINSETERKSG